MMTEAAILLLLARPECGNVPAGSDLAQHLVRTAVKESGGDPLVIGVNADPARGLPAAKVRSSTVAEAVANARTLWAQRRRLDLGLFQISDANLERHHLTLEAAFTACSNAAAGAEHLADDFRAAAWTLAHRRYNCGGFDCGVAYAAAISSVTAASPSIAATMPAPPHSCAPTWDAWALASCANPSASSARNTIHASK